MKYKYPLNNSLKESLKKIDILLKTKRLVFKYFSLYKYIKLIISFFRSKKIFSFRLLKKISFDTNNKTYYITNENHLYYLLKTSDTQISRSIAVNSKDRIKALKILKNFRDLINIEKKEKVTNLIDIGAAIGNTVVPAIGYNYFESVIAIEPSVENFNILKINCQINKIFDVIEFYNIAITDKDYEDILFELADDDLGDHRVKFQEYAGLLDETKRKKIKVQSRTFDSLFKNFKLENYAVWLNNQGSEAYVLSGGYKSFSENNIPIMIEFSPYYIKNSNSKDLLFKCFKNLKFNKIFYAETKEYLGNVKDFDFEKLYNSLGERGNFTYLIFI